MSINNKYILYILRAARNKISDPEHWTQRSVARDYYDIECASTSDTAYKYCMIGAINSITRTHVTDITDYLRDVMRERYPDIRSLAAFNDLHTHAEVIALLDAAITKLEIT